MSSTIAIDLQQVSKRYKRFAKAHFRVLDLLGVPLPRSTHSDFWALRDVTLSIPRGARLGLIGRNGAGKSTLLRMISGQSAPSEGKVRVDGKVQALMELGTGFHPDFTGLENIRSALAYNLLSVGEIKKKTDEIIDFTELEAFIDRPVREYSAGMYARLAFAVATSINPEILIIDEILGAGDAYFTRKSIARMKAIAESGATILFVSHDMSSVQMLCDRAIWMHRGQLLMDGDTLAVGKAYLASIREEEEERQRARTLQLTSGQAATRAGGQRVFRLIGPDGSAPTEKVLIGSIRLMRNTKVLEQIDPASGSGDRDGSALLVDPGNTNWGATFRAEDRLGRWFGNFGGRFSHGPFTLRIPDDVSDGLSLEIDHWSETNAEVALQAFDPSRADYHQLGCLTGAEGQRGWVTSQFDLAASGADARSAGASARAPGDEAGHAADLEASDGEELELVDLDETERYGSGEIKITSFGFVAAGGPRQHTFQTGDTVEAVFKWQAEKPVADASAVIAVYMGDGTCAMQVVSDRDGFDLGILEGTGQIRVRFSPLLLGPGEYIASVALFKELDIRSAHEPKAYDLHDRCYTLKILPPAGMATEIGIVNQKGDWKKQAHGGS